MDVLPKVSLNGSRLQSLNNEIVKYHVATMCLKEVGEIKTRYNNDL